MKLISIEPTPSPNTMKLNLDESLPKGVKMTYTANDHQRPPEYVRQLLDIPGVKGVFHTADFIALDRTPQADWPSILARAGEILGDPANPAQIHVPEFQTDGWGEVNVWVQTFRGIPMQIRVGAGTEQTRAAMPERFIDAAMKAGSASPVLLKERKLEDYGVRYGELQEVISQVVQELDAAYPEERLSELTERAIRQGDREPEPDLPRKLEADEVARWLNHPDWKKRYAALQSLAPSADTLPLLVRALQDDNMSIRRLATVYLGDIRHPDVFAHLFRALKDPSPAVRRTAGDTLSDLGDPVAIAPMCEALRDANKLVRWRAARFLYEVGDATALDALRGAQDDPEFEVALQVRMALERIEQGEEAGGTVWQQMTRRNRETKK